MPRTHRPILALIAVLAVVLAACGSDAGAERSGALTVTDATVDVPANPSQAAVRLVIDNQSDVDDELLSVSSPVAGGAAVHRSEVDDEGRATMSEVKGLSVPADEQVRFEPGGLHVMLTELNQPLAAGDTFDLVLTFAEAGEQTVEVAVAGGPSADGSHDMDDMDHETGDTAHETGTTGHEMSETDQDNGS